MKRFPRLFPALVIALLVSIAPAAFGENLGLGVDNAQAAVTQNVYCKDGFNGYTTDPTAFCKTHGGPADVSGGTRPYACVDGTTQTAADASTACAAHGGGAIASASTVCGPNAIQVSIPIFTKDGKCVPNDSASGGAIVWYTKQLIKLASGAVGSVILLMLLIAGIQYITAGGDPGRVKLAKTRITNAIIGLFLFLMAFAILSFLIPGGIFS
jgi:hypothetical protein